MAFALWPLAVDAAEVLSAIELVDRDMLAFLKSSTSTWIIGLRVCALANDLFTSVVLF